MDLSLTLILLNFLNGITNLPFSERFVIIFRDIPDENFKMTCQQYRAWSDWMDVLKCCCLLKIMKQMFKEKKQGNKTKKAINHFCHILLNKPCACLKDAAVMYQGKKKMFQTTLKNRITYTLTSYTTLEICGHNSLNI